MVYRRLGYLGPARRVCLAAAHLADGSSIRRDDARPDGLVPWLGSRATLRGSADQSPLSRSDERGCRLHPPKPSLFCTPLHESQPLALTPKHCDHPRPSADFSVDLLDEPLAPPLLQRCPD